MSIVLIDGNSILFRAFYATSHSGYLMQSKSGLYTNALYGFVNMLQKVLADLEPTHVLIAFDAGKQTFRHQEYSEYKGTRKKMPEELAMQIPYVKNCIDILGLKRFETLDYEADDIIGTVAKREAKEGHDVTVISGDKDLLQLVDEKIKVVLTKKGITDLEEYNIHNFKDMMGFSPNQIIDYKGLIGDASDNLPGIRGVGPKTALDLLSKYGTVENIISAIPELSGKLKEKVESDQAQALQSKRLATLYLDVPVDIPLEELKRQSIDYAKLRQFYESVDFNSFIKKMDASQDIYQDNEKVSQVKEKEIDIIINDLEQTITNFNKDCYLEIELEGENYHKANVLGIAFLFDSKGYFLDKQYLYDERIKAYLENSEFEKKTIDSKRIIVALAKIGIDIKNISFDFVLSSYIINPSYPNGDLHSIFEHFIPTTLAFQDEVYGKKSIYKIPFEEEYAKYSLHKCEHLKRAEGKILSLLKKNKQMDLLNEMEIPLAFVLADMELNGFKIDKRRLEEIGSTFEKEMKRLEQEIYDATGEEFNIGSPKQLGVILFEKLKLGKGRKTKTGYSTAADVLESLAEDHLVPRLVLEYRKYSKLYSTYVVGLLNEIDETDGKVHTIFKQALTLTGRLSSVEPNIQNIPVRSEEGRLIRSAFVPSYDYLVSADYSQIELRILAHMAKSKNMIDDFNHGLDLHASTASKVNDVPLDEVTKQMRSYAKAINFGIIYGMSDWGLSETLHISPGEASRFIEKYFEIYPEIKVFLDKIIEDAKRLGYSTTLFNRRRYLPELKSSNHALRKFGERTSMNAPLQGTAADIIKRAMIEVSKTLKNKGLKSKLVAQVHDELILDVVSSELEIVKNELKTTMEQATKLDVVLSVDVEVGKNWNLK